MKSKFTSLIMGIIVLLIIGVFVILGLIFIEEFKQVEATIEPEHFKTVINDNINTIKKNIETLKVIKNPLDDISDEMINNEVDYSYVQIDKYYYSQLEEPSKTIYKAFEVNQENLKIGNYKIELGDSFSSILKRENGQEELGKYYQSAFEAYNYDNPEVFYLSPEKMYLNIETTTTRKETKYYVYINSGDEGNYFSDEFSSKTQIDSAINQIELVKNKIVSNRKEDTYQNIKMVHDYLVDNLEYDITLSRKNIYDIYGALVNGVSVCEGYARSFKYLMDEMKIPCVLVIGKGTNSQGKTENHAWNYVQVNDEWYAIDATWDDPVVSGGSQSRESKYKYFLKGSNTFSQDHTPNGQFTPNGKVFNYPTISVEDYKN